MELTYETFMNNIKEFQNKSDEIHDGWYTCNEKSFFTEHFTYLCKKVHKESKTSEDIYTFEYHIVYDGSYSVPKLCFNVFKSDGSLLKLEECIKQFSFVDTDDLFKILTQMDHPVLQRPFFCLHPCKSSELMQLVATTSKNPVITWLSTIGPSIGIQVDNNYSELT